jgi:hypothetical protein
MQTLLASYAENIRVFRLEDTTRKLKVSLHLSGFTHYRLVIASYIPDYEGSLIPRRGGRGIVLGVTSSESTRSTSLQAGVPIVLSE